MPPFFTRSTPPRAIVMLPPSLHPPSEQGHPMKLAFIGFRHAHIMETYHAAKNRADITVVAACEENPATAARLTEQGQVRLTHDNYARMLAEADCDAVAV